MDVFFYGLFMDDVVLNKNGVKPSNIRKGYAQDYEIKIGSRASLIRSVGEKSFGLVMSVDKSAIDRLYSEASVAEYVSEEVKVILDSGDSLIAKCYNLPKELLTGTNVIYANSLLKLARQLNFPDSYLAKIESYC